MEKLTSHEIIHPKDFYDLFARFKMPAEEQDWWIIRWGIIAGLTIIAVICLYFALVFDKITLFQLLLSAVSVPLWVGAYLFFPGAIATVFNRLWNVGVIGEYKGDAQPALTYQDLVTKLARQIHAPWISLVGAVIVIVFWFNRWYAYLADGVSGALLTGGFHWVYLAVFCLSVLYSLIIFIAFISVVRLLLVAVAMNRLFSSFTINVFPMHPDGSGGLGGLHQLLWINNIMLIAGLCLIIALTSRHTDSFFVSMLLFGYLILFPAILTVWLALPHRAMLQARNTHLQHIVDEYDRTLQETENTITEPTPAIAEGTERLATLQKRHEQVKTSFPTWPVEISFTRRLGATLILPLLTSFVPAVINMITKLVK